MNGISWFNDQFYMLSMSMYCILHAYNAQSRVLHHICSINVNQQQQKLTIKFKIITNSNFICVFIRTYVNVHSVQYHNGYSQLEIFIYSEIKSQIILNNIWLQCFCLAKLLLFVNRCCFNKTNRVYMHTLPFYFLFLFF